MLVTIEPQEAAVALVGLHHHPIAGAKARVAAIGIDDAAVDDGGIDSAGIQQGGNHAGGGGLAMRSGHGNGAFKAHQLGQHLGAAHHGNARLKGGRHLWIIALDRRAGDNHRRIAQILALVANHYRDAAGAQPFHHIPLGNVGALHPVAQIVHHLGNARHANAANADEMDRADFCANALHHRASLSGARRASVKAPPDTNASCPLADFARPTRMTSINGSPPNPSTRSARSLAAWG